LTASFGVASCPARMIGRSDATRRPALQLHLDLGESVAPATALWGILPEAEREVAAALVAKLIARTVVPDEADGSAVGEDDER
jgi:hypothetical protein